MNIRTTLILVVSAFAALIGAASFFHRSSNEEKANQTRGPIIQKEDELNPLEINSYSKNIKNGELITPPSAETLLKHSLEKPNFHERLFESCKVIAKLCKAGFTEEAWKMIENDEGSIRTGQLDAFFKDSNLTIADALSKIDKIPLKGDKGTAVSGYLGSLAPENLRELIDNKSLDKFVAISNQLHPSAFTNILSGTLHDHLWKPGPESEKRNILNLATDFHNRGLVDDSGYALILDASPSIDSFEKFSLLSGSSKELLPDPDTERLRKKMISAMIDSNAGKALDQISKVKGYQGTSALSTALEKYGTADPVGANQWFVTNQSTLAPEQRDSAAFAFFKLAVKEQETEGARAWMDQIQNPKIKKQATDQLAKATKPEAR